jgi:hypothetical protein
MKCANARGYYSTRTGRAWRAGYVLWDVMFYEATQENKQKAMQGFGGSYGNKHRWKGLR